MLVRSVIYGWGFDFMRPFQAGSKVCFAPAYFLPLSENIHMHIPPAFLFRKRSPAHMPGCKHLAAVRSRCQLFAVHSPLEIRFYGIPRVILKILLTIIKFMIIYFTWAYEFIIVTILLEPLCYVRVKAIRTAGFTAGRCDSVIID